MATKFSTCFLCWNFSGLNCKHSNVRFPPESRRLFPASCRMRQHSLSSHHKKQQIRKASQEQPTTGSGLHLNDDGDSELKMVSPDGTSSLDKKNLTRTHTDYSDHVEHTNAVNLNSPTVLAETTPPVTHIDGVEKNEQLSDSQLKDLLAKIGNAEKNILLLNQARLCAVKDLENIVAEKEALQGEIKILEMRLAEAVAQIKVASQEKIHVELLEDQLEKMHIELIDNGSTERGETQLHQSQHRVSIDEPVEDMPWEFWSQILLIIDGWMLEKKLSTKDAALLREMAWKRHRSIHDTYIACKEQNEHEAISAFLRLTSSAARPGLHVIHIAAEMAPVAKVGGLADVVTGLSKALQKKGHLVEIVLPKYDCMKYDGIHDFRTLDVVIESYFDGQLFRNKIWLGTVEGLPVYFIEPHHPYNFFWRGNIYGEHDDFKRFSFFSRAALEFLLQAGKKPDIIHCHDWQTAFVAPMYWEIYALKGLDSARICFTCHNFEHQGIASASDLASCGLDVQRVNRPDRMQDNSADDKVNVVKGGIIFSNIVTTVSPTYAQEVQTAEGGHGLHSVLASHSRKFCGILNGIDTDAWNPSTDIFLKVQYSANDLHGKTENKESIRRQLDLSSADFRRPLVSCITRLVPQKGVHLIRHAMYQTLELGGQFVLLGSSPVKHIQKEFEGIANCFQNHDDIRLILKYDESLSHAIYAASDMFIIPSIFEPCGLTQMISMRYGAIPIARRTGGLKDSVFDIDDNTVPSQFRNGFTFLNADEQGLSNALERAFNLYMNNPESWQQLVQKDMNIDFSWEASVPQYEDLYLKAVTRERERAPRRL